jgi:hypothetical protein
MNELSPEIRINATETWTHATAKAHPPNILRATTKQGNRSAAAMWLSWRLHPNAWVLHNVVRKRFTAYIRG